MEKKAQRRKLRHTLDPMGGLTRGYLSLRSPLYKDLKKIEVNADKIFRDTVYTQKAYLRNLKKDMKDLAVETFAQRVAAFLREQVLLVKTTEHMTKQFVDAINANEDIEETVSLQNLKDIGYYISTSIGKTPKYNPNQMVEKDIDIKEEWAKKRPSMWRRWVTEYFGRGTKGLGYGTEEKSPRLEQTPQYKQSDNINHLIKDAFLASWLWGRTKAGREFKKSFAIVYGYLERMFNRNIAILESLDKSLASGDLQSYWETAKNEMRGFKANLIQYGEDPRFLEAWKKFESVLQKGVGPQTEEDTTAQPTSVEQTITEQPISEEPIEIEEEPTKESHSIFISKLIKAANNNMPKEKVALMMLKYSSYIDQTDPEYALKLIAITEGLLDG